MAKEVDRILSEIGIKIIGFRYCIDREGQVQQTPIVKKIDSGTDMRGTKNETQ